MQKPTTETRQNRVTVRYVDPDGHKLNEALSLFGAVGSDYHINIPVFDGYWLTDATAPIAGVIPAERRLVITLTYTKLGVVRLRQDGHEPLSFPLRTRRDDATKVAPVVLPDEPEGMRYYRVQDQRLHLIENSEAYIPPVPGVDTEIECLPPAVADARSNQVVEADASALQKPELAAPQQVGDSLEDAAPKRFATVAGLLAKALVQQATLLDAQALTPGQSRVLRQHMQTFLDAFAILNER